MGSDSIDCKTLRWCKEKQNQSSLTPLIYFNDVNELVVNQVFPNAYDANGNLIGDNTRTYKWDAENRLVQVSLKTQPSVNYTFSYDGLGHRIAISGSNGS